MNIYHVDPETGRLLWGGIASESPLEPGVFLIPAGATDLAPPEEREGFIRRFIDGAWGYSPENTPGEPPTEEPVINPAMVDTERDRRIDAGFSFNGTAYDYDAKSKSNISAMALDAFMAITAGAKVGNFRWNGSDTDFTWIAADNTTVPMDAQTMVSFSRAAAHHESWLIQAARALKDMDPIPSDYADDGYWVATPVPTPLVADPAPGIYAMSELTISDGMISAFNSSARIGGAFYADVGEYWVFFAQTQDTANYIVLCYNHDHEVHVSDRYVDFFIIKATKDGVPSDPSIVNVEVKKVS